MNTIVKKQVEEVTRCFNGLSKRKQQRLCLGFDRMIKTGVAHAKEVTKNKHPGSVRFNK